MALKITFCLIRKSHPYLSQSIKIIIYHFHCTFHTGTHWRGRQYANFVIFVLSWLSDSKTLSANILCFCFSFESNISTKKTLLTNDHGCRNQKLSLEKTIVNISIKSRIKFNPIVTKCRKLHAILRVWLPQLKFP